jgi:integrase
MAEVYPITNLEEVRAVRRVLKKWGNVREAEAFFINCHMGLRVGDLLKLKFSQMTGKSFIVKEEKTKKNREIPLTPLMKDSIAILKQWYKDNHQDVTPVYLFQATARWIVDDKPISSQYLYKKIKDACEAAGIEDNIGTHTMRKTFGYHIFQSTGDLTNIQKIFGHASQAETLAYIGVTRKTQNAMYLNLDMR